MSAGLATVCGGLANTASGLGSFVAGGGITGELGQGAYYVAPNQASGTSAAVPGGAGNTAAGKFSLAAGYRAKANHDGSLAWGDSTEKRCERQDFYAAFKVAPMINILRPWTREAWRWRRSKD